MSSVKELSILIVGLLMSTVLMAQKNDHKVVTGEYTYYFNTNVSFDEAKRVSYDRARIDLIGENFGTSIYEVSSSNTKSVNNVSSVNFSSMSKSELGGEWLETIGDVVYSTPNFSNNMYSITIKLTGRIRKFMQSKSEFDVKILNNGDNGRFESSEFKSGDSLYIFFKSPVNGYLAIYFCDESGNATFLAPYKKMEKDIIPIIAGKEYLFYKSNTTAYSDDGHMQWHMTNNGKFEEHDDIYIIFSPNEFYGPIYNSQVSVDSEIHITGSEDFKSWLGKNRIRDVGMQVYIEHITISPEFN